MDTYFAVTDKDYRNPGAADPVFLYDDSIFNDDAYIYNADVLFEYVNAGISRTVKGIPSDNFDVHEICGGQASRCGICSQVC